MAVKIDGKTAASRIRAQAARETARLKERGIVPGLATVLVGDNPASKLYVSLKEKACAGAGIYSEKHVLPASADGKEVLDLLRSLNRNPKVNGILVQLPLPGKIALEPVLEAVDPLKDVDGFHPENVGRLVLGNPRFVPCTPAGVLELLHREKIEIRGKFCVVVGRSDIVGKPLASLLLNADGTIAVCHSKTRGLKRICREADILIAAVGKPKFVTADMVKPGAVVIDVGADRDENGKLCGDVDSAEVGRVASFLTPVPGGVGPMTIAMLLRNTVKAAKIQNGIPCSGTC